MCYDRCIEGQDGAICDYPSNNAKTPYLNPCIDGDACTEDQCNASGDCVGTSVTGCGICNGGGIPATCIVFPDDDGTPPYENFEGRCLPECVPATQMKARYNYDADGDGSTDEFVILEQGTCGAGELCTPCFSPATGEDLGTCRLNGDVPTTTASANMYDECCSLDGTFDGPLVGTCVPEQFPYSDTVSKAPKEDYDDDDTPDYCDDDHVCIPKVVAKGGSTPHCNDSYVGTNWPQLQEPEPDDHAIAYCNADGIFSVAAIGGGNCAPRCGLQLNGGPT
ncbi:MAG: hypothetical protein GY851_16880, partial [bacterium]|nr:hypothetical protein [bacterium]